MYFTSWYLEEVLLNPLLGDISTFLGPLTHLFSTSDDVCPGFQSQDGSLHLHASSHVHNGTLRFTYGVTPADLLVASTAAEPFTSTYLPTSSGGAHDRYSEELLSMFSHIDYLDRKLPG